jgi:hypothetical protein
MTTPSARFFFVHVMKTAGSTFRRHIHANFDPDQVYPCRQYDGDLSFANVNLEYLVGLSAERHAAIKAYAGHFPFMAVDTVPGPFVTITILRDPIERTISLLKQCQRYNARYRDRSLEQIYEDPFLFPCLIKNHQTKLFALDTADRPRSYMDLLDIDAARMAAAKANLARVDVLGLQEHFGTLLAHMQERFGWRITVQSNRRVSKPFTVSRAFRARIAHDNAADLEFFEYARELYHDRRRVA